MKFQLSLLSLELVPSAAWFLSASVMSKNKLQAIFLVIMRQPNKKLGTLEQGWKDEFSGD